MPSTVLGVTLPDGLDYLADIEARLRADEASMPLLSDTPCPDTQDAPQRSIQERFEAFHTANPWVYDRLRNLALELVDHGHQHIGIGMLWEVLRWQTLTAAKVSVEAGAPKLDNSYRSRYARLLMDREPRLAGVFETRVLRSHP